MVNTTKMHIDALLNEEDTSLYSYGATPVEKEGHAAQGTKKQVVSRTIIDSGAAENVLPEDHCLVGNDTLGTSSKKGTVYTEATGHKAVNKGQVSLMIETWEGGKAELRYQVTRVAQSLTSVARLCDLGNTVTFTSEGGEIISRSTGRRTKFDRKKGVYVLEVSAEAEKAPFHRQAD